MGKDIKRELVLKEDLIQGFKKLGLEKGQNIMVHASLSSLGFVCGGEQIVIESLIDAVGEEGTLMMPTQTWKNLDPSSGVHWEEPEEWYEAIRNNWPAYNKDITPTNTMGKVAEMFRKWPNAKRSNHPVRSVAALGKNAEYLTENHNLENIFGENSPIDKLYKLDGYVLLIGVGYDKNTSIHLADTLAKYPSKHHEDNSCAMIVNGEREWVTYKTLYVDGEDFEKIGEDFEKSNKVKSLKIGNATVKFMKQRDLVDFSIKWIESNRK
ncbi:aminoglycoside N(3)-acetyltransferase [Clostridium sp. B9]|uniref:aminoglycoside N(3)-acetyltransferase n=1 Tax=Clostridium sp. B9 TaxID=3423224 RepID=UPI003D2F096A